MLRSGGLVRQRTNARRARNDAKRAFRRSSTYTLADVEKEARHRLGGRTSQNDRHLASRESLFSATVVAVTDGRHVRIMSWRWQSRRLLRFRRVDRRPRLSLFDYLLGISARAPKCTLCVVSCAAGIRSLPDQAPLRSINTWLLKFLTGEEEMRAFAELLRRSRPQMGSSPEERLVICGISWERYLALDKRSATIGPARAFTTWMESSKS